VSDTTSILLHDIAEKIQLTPTLHKLAVARYETINGWLERDGSPLRGHIVRLYPQGSMMIGAAISSRLDTDEFDIDLVLELALRSDVAPGQVLDTVDRAIAGERGSRYHGMTKRQTRCVTVNYEGMHLDLTPAVRLLEWPERTSLIFHSKPEEAPYGDRSIIANPWGFGRWFEDRTPPEPGLVEDAQLRKAMADPVKDQEPADAKSLALISLQLIKRWRNIVYDCRDARRPPSVLIAKLIGDAATGRSGSLYEELLRQIEHIHAVLDAAHTARHTVHVVNPACGRDVFSDRWPEDLAAQATFLRDLAQLHEALTQLASASMSDNQKILMRLFGEHTARVVVAEFAKRAGERALGGGLYYGGGAAGVAGMETTQQTRPATMQPIPRHTFYGDGTARQPR
jgi:hypothetical protein